MQSREGWRCVNDKDRPYDLAVALGHPAAIARGHEVADEFREYAGEQALEAPIPPILARVQDALSMEDPAEIPRIRRP